MGSMNNLAELLSGDAGTLYMNIVSGKGTLLSTIAVFYRLMFRTANIGFFRAFSNEEGPDGTDFMVHTMKSIFELDGDESSMVAMSASEAMEMIADGREDEVVDRV